MSAPRPAPRSKRSWDGLGRSVSRPPVRNHDGGSLSPRVENKWCVLGEAAGISPADDGEAFGPHVLRHTFGTDLVCGRVISPKSGWTW